VAAPLPFYEAADYLVVTKKTKLKCPLFPPDPPRTNAPFTFG